MLPPGECAVSMPTGQTDRRTDARKLFLRVPLDATSVKTATQYQCVVWVALVAVTSRHLSVAFAFGLAS